MSIFLIRQVRSGIKFDLTAANGQVILASEVYASETACRSGIESIRKNAPIAKVEDQTLVGFKPITHPKFELYEDRAGAFRFRLKARNGQIIGVSEGYKNKASCKNGIESVQKNAPEAEVLSE